MDYIGLLLWSFQCPGESPGSGNEDHFYFAYMKASLEQSQACPTETIPQKQEEKMGHMTPLMMRNKPSRLLDFIFEEGYCWVAGKHLGRPGWPQACSHPPVFASSVEDFRCVAQISLKMADWIHLK